MCTQQQGSKIIEIDCHIIKKSIRFNVRQEREYFREKKQWALRLCKMAK